jgi:hypothetical protein
MTTDDVFVCIDGIVPVWSDSDPRSERLTELLFGEEFVAKSEHEGIVLGATGTDLVEGFVPRASLASKTNRPTHRVRRPLIHVYHAPDLVMAAGKMLPMNALVTLTGRSAAVRYPGGGPGSSAVELLTGGWVTEHGVAAIHDFEKHPGELAKSFIGAVYLHGGKTWRGCDGPGLVQTVLAACGHAVPRQINRQILFCEQTYQEVSASSVNPTAASVIYAGESCGLLLGSTVMAARTDTIHVDATPFEEFIEGRRTPPRMFALPFDPAS